SMLSDCDAALVIGDNALCLDRDALRRVSESVALTRGVPASTVTVEAIDLGQVWTDWTGLPFVYAFWVGAAGALDAGAMDDLREARDSGVSRAAEIARAYFASHPAHQERGERYLRDNI